MTASFKPQNQPVTVTTQQVAMPVGTNIILSMDKFMFDKRDVNCNSCRSGYKSTLPKSIDGKMYNVCVICTCVPYLLNADEEKTGIVVYKGRKENWVKGVRPESEIQAELIREGAAANALYRQQEAERLKNNPNAKSERAIREKSLQNAEKPRQKVMQQDKNGHWIFVDTETGKKMGLTISDVSNPAINKENPEAQPKPQPQPQENQGDVPASAAVSPTPTPTVDASVAAQRARGGRPETDEEFLLRTTGEAPINEDVTFLSQEVAQKIDAAKAAPKPIAKSQPAPVAPTAPAPVAEVKRGRGRPKGSTKKA
jgi:hypothetical protein